MGKAFGGRTHAACSVVYSHVEADDADGLTARIFFYLFYTVSLALHPVLFHSSEHFTRNSYVLVHAGQGT